MAMPSITVDSFLNLGIRRCINRHVENLHPDLHVVSIDLPGLADMEPDGLTWWMHLWIERKVDRDVEGADRFDWQYKVRLGIDGIFTITG